MSQCKEWIKLPTAGSIYPWKHHCGRGENHTGKHSCQICSQEWDTPPKPLEHIVSLKELPKGKGWGWTCSCGGASAYTGKDAELAAKTAAEHVKACFVPHAIAVEEDAKTGEFSWKCTCGEGKSAGTRGTIALAAALTHKAQVSNLQIPQNEHTDLTKAVQNLTKAWRDLEKAWNKSRR